jgi:hypothetical protein
MSLVPWSLVIDWFKTYRVVCHHKEIAPNRYRSNSTYQALAKLILE